MLGRTEYSHTIQNGIFYPAPAESMRRFFSNIHSEHLVELQEVKLTEDWGPPKDGPTELVSLKLVYT